MATWTLRDTGTSGSEYILSGYMEPSGLIAPYIALPPPWPLWPSAGVSGLGFRVLGFSGLGFWVFGFRVSGLGFRGFKLNHDKTREQPLPRDTENLGRHAWSTGSSESPVQVCGS